MAQEIESDVLRVGSVERSHLFCLLHTCGRGISCSSCAVLSSMLPVLYTCVVSGLVKCTSLIPFFVRFHSQ